MLAIQPTNIFRRILLENLLRGNAFASGGPHISNIKILSTVIVIIEPANTHSRADVLNSRLWGDISKSPIPIITVKILPSEIIHHIEIRPPVPVVIAPPTAETVARIVLVEARSGGHVAESSVTMVTHHEVGWSIFRVVIRNGILVLVGSLVIRVEAKI